MAALPVDKEARPGTAVTSSHPSLDAHPHKGTASPAHQTTGHPGNGPQVPVKGKGDSRGARLPTRLEGDNTPPLGHTLVEGNHGEVHVLRIPRLRAETPPRNPPHTFLAPYLCLGPREEEEEEVPGA